jgi:hypothetical protein
MILSSIEIFVPSVLKQHLFLPTKERLTHLAQSTPQDLRKVIDKCSLMGD